MSKNSKQMQKYNLEQVERFSNELFSYLKGNDTESFDQVFIDSKESPFLDKQDAKIIIEIGFLNLKKDSIYKFKDSYEMTQVKNTLELLYSDAQDKILENTLFPLFLQFLHYGDIQYCEHLIKVSQDKGLSFDLIKAMNYLLDLLYQDLLLDFEEEQEYMELVNKKWIGTLKLLKEYGLSTSYDVVPALEKFDPDTQEDEEFYLRILGVFIDEGFLFSNGLESDNSFIKAIALKQIKTNEVHAKA